MIVRHCSGAVLAGGANARFGGLPKGLAEIGGRRVVDRVLDAVGEATDESFLITNDTAIRDSVRAVPAYGDVRAERSSLVGLHSALSHCRAAALVVAWDMPFVSSALLQHLRALGEQVQAPAIPSGSRGPEPLCAYYPRWVLETVERQVDQGEMRLSAFVASLTSPVILSADEVARFGSPRRLFANVNTPAELAAARKREARRGTQRLDLLSEPVAEHR
jgi:molybdopterin-guanine dinucleotide biosynthesis protein A